MSGTKEGGLKARDTNRAKYGEDFYRRIAIEGGSKRVLKGFALMSPEKRSAAGRKGGSVKPSEKRG